MTWLHNAIFNPAWGWTSVRPDCVLMMLLIFRPQTSSHRPAFRILAEAALSSWRPQNSATSADTDLSMKNYHQNFRGQSDIFTSIQSHPGVKDYPTPWHTLSKINKIFYPQTRIMSNKKFYGFCRPGLKESSQEIIHSQDVWSSDFCLLDLDSCKTLYQKDISRCPPTRRSSSWSSHRGSLGPPRSWGSSWAGWARRGPRRTGEQSGRARGAPRTDRGAGKLRLLLQRPIAAKY